MRSHQLTRAVAVTGALLALTPAAAAAHSSKHASKRQSGPCRVTLRVAPHLLTSGEAALASGTGTCGAHDVSGQAVTLYERAAGSPGYSVAGTATTNEAGAYQIPTGVLTTNASFYAAIGSARSQLRAVRVAAVVSLNGPQETKSLTTGRRNAVTFSGTVSPDDAGATVVLQRENAARGTEWHRISRPVLVDSNGNFSITHAFVVPGASSIRVVVRSNHRNTVSQSNVLSYAVSQAENPQLTIESSQDPLPYGSSSTISGTVAGEPHTTLTLLGRTAGGRFAPITTTTSDATGAYSFAPQTPSASTFYEVRAGGRSSAVLYQGVKYVLTASPSASSVSSGQPLTFSGTVTPAAAGHTIYLERQNVRGTGFHVVAVGSVLADGTYSVTRTFFAPGSYVLRVKIPGDSVNAGTAGTATTITVTAIPTAQVPPESPGNGELPPAGQT